MSLQVWLPLNNKLIANQGLNLCTIENNGATFVDDGIESCYSFDGNDHYIDTNYMSNLGNGNFSFAAWIYVTQVNGKTWQCIIGNKSAPAASVGCALYWNQNYKKFLWSTANGTNASEIWSADTFDDVIYNTWHHIVMVRNSNDPKKGYFYFDGVRKELESIPSIVNVSNSSVSMKIGTVMPINNSYCYTGKISDVRIYNHALSDKEVSELAKGLVFHLKLNSTKLYNIAGFDYDIHKYSYGALTEAYNTARYDKSLIFDNSAIKCNNININGNSKFTISCWINITVQKDYQPLFWIGDDSNNTSGICLHGSNCNRLEGNDGTGLEGHSFDVYYPAQENPLNTWVHNVLVYDGETIKRYINGELKSSLSFNYGFGNTLQTLYIGHFWHPTSNFEGMLSDFRIYRTALNANQVSQLYHVAGSIDNHGNAHSYELIEIERYDDRLRFQSIGNSTIGLASKSSNQTIEYSKDCVNWASMDTTTTIDLTNNEVVYLRGILSGNNSTANYTQFNMTGAIKSYGNINYLWNYNNLNASLKKYCAANLFKDCTSLLISPELPSKILSEACYGSMFKGCTNLIEVPKLPATSLAEWCYSEMFRDCTSLKEAPILSATSLANYCYYAMFYGCSNLIKTYNLPAQTLTEQCYAEMFRYCVSLTTTPKILATTMAKQSCYNMFKGCTSLVSVQEELSASVLAQSCYYAMFAQCTSLTKAPKLSINELAQSCYTSMFYECSSLIEAPVLSSNSLALGCYQLMFYGCQNLVNAPELPATTLATNCYAGMFQYCYSLTTAPELLAEELVEGCYSYMFNGCSNLNYIRCLATNISATDCTTNWVKNVASSGTFVKLNDEIPWTIGVNGIPVNWTVISAETLLFKSTGNSTLGLNRKSSYQTVQYSSDGETWNDMTTSTNISLSDGQKVYVRGKLTNNNTGSNYTQFKMTGSLECNGNINYLWDYENPNAALKDYCGYYLFRNCTSLTKAPKMPTTTLADHCYCSMFAYCSSLTSAPELPATTLSQYCYQYMFQNCTSLTTAPEILATTVSAYCCSHMFDGCASLVNVQEELPATTLANSCYEYMFEYCYSLIVAPVLPAQIMTPYCYQGMFYSCSSLRYIRCMATDISATNCMYYWVGGVSEIGTFVKDPNMKSLTRSWWDQIYNYWDIENYYENPDVEFIPDITFTNDNAIKLEVKENNSIIQIPILCTYQTLYLSKDKTHWMTLHDGNRLTVQNGETYYLCGTLTAAHNRLDYTNIRLLGKIDASGNINTIWNYSNPNAALYSCCGNQLFSQSTGLENAGLTLPSMTVPSTAYWQMFYGCTRLTTAPELPATTIIGDCYYLMFRYCSSLIQTPSVLPAATITNYCYTNMFSQCTSLVTVPKGLLPALEVKEASYAGMFYGCTSLTSAPDLPATTFTNTRQYSNMFQNCTSLTTAPELPAQTLTNQCYQNMFNGCTNLSYIKCLATNISASSCLSNWTSGVSSTGTFVKNSTMSSWTSGTSGIPTNWTVQDAQ